MTPRRHWWLDALIVVAALVVGFALAAGRAIPVPVAILFGVLAFIAVRLARRA